MDGWMGDERPVNVWGIIPLVHLHPAALQAKCGQSICLKRLSGLWFVDTIGLSFTGMCEGSSGVTLCLKEIQHVPAKSTMFC